MQKIFFSIILILGLISCKQLKSDKDISLEIRGHSGHFLLLIKNFKWSYGTAELNKFNGDFEALDKMVYDSLKGRFGDCVISIANTQINKYGSVDSTRKTIGILDLKEFNKFQNWEYWHKDGGIKHLLYKNFIAKPSVDSAVMDSARMDSASTIDTIPVIPVTTVKPKRTIKTYDFSYKDLFPMAEERSSLTDDFSLHGVISTVNFDNGVMVIRDDKDVDNTVQFFPMNGSTFTYQQLQLAIKPGNKINATCGMAAASVINLLSAEITER